MIKWQRIKLEEIVESIKGTSYKHKRRFHGNRRIKLCPKSEAVKLNHTSFKIEVFKPTDEFLSVRMTNDIL